MSIRPKVVMKVILCQFHHVEHFVLVEVIIAMDEILSKQSVRERLESNDLHKTRILFDSVQKTL
jgi:5-bromo-4-chloroindolyl phosphate hydrolysis protein